MTQTRTAMTEKRPTDAPELIELNLMLAEAIAPTDPPSGAKQAIRQRLLARISRSLTDHAGLRTVRREDGNWRRIVRGIQIKPLWHGPQGNSVLIELSPGATLPVHRHLWVEEGIVLEGEVQIGGQTLGPLDYQVLPAGSQHTPICSPKGALAFLRGTSLGRPVSLLRELVGGIWPSHRESGRIVLAGSGGWVEVARGIEKKQLWSDGKLTSCFFRLAPGSRLAGHLHPADEECLMLAGELFLGDVLLRAGDYQLALAGSCHGEVYTDVGALLFVRAAAS